MKKTPGRHNVGGFPLTLWEKCFRKLDNAVKLLLKNLFFHHFLTIGNHHTKQLTPSENCDHNNFLDPGFERSPYLKYDAQIFPALWPPNQGEHLDGLIYDVWCVIHNLWCSRPVSCKTLIIWVRGRPKVPPFGWCHNFLLTKLWQNSTCDKSQKT